MILSLGTYFRVLEQPVQRLVIKTVTVRLALVLAVIHDIVDEDVVHASDIGRIARRTEVHLVLHRTERILEQSRLVMVMVPDHVEGHHIHAVRILQVDREHGQLVVYHVTEFDAVARRLDLRAGLYDVGNHHVAICLGRVVDIEVLDLRVALHDKRMVVGLLPARLEYKIGREGLDIARYALEGRRQAVACRNLIFGRDRQHYEMTVPEVARHLVTAFGIGLRTVQTVTYDHSRNGLAVGRGHTSRNIGSLRLGGADRRKHEQ